MVVTDLDGTLWGPDEVVAPSAIDALAQLDRQGILVLAVTGRPLDEVAQRFKGQGIDLPVVALNGALGVASVGGELLFARVFEPVEEQVMAAAFVTEGVEPDRYRLGDQVPGVDAGHGLLCAVAYSIDPVVGRRLESVLLEQRVGAPVLCRDVIHGGATLVVPPRGTSKWNGVREWAAAVGQDISHVMAVGDGENDLDILRHARVPVGVRSGAKSVLALAADLIDPPDDGGWAGLMTIMGRYV